MRVLLVSNETEIIGGGELSLLLLLGGLNGREDVEPILAVPADGEVAERAGALGIEVVELPLPRMRHQLWRLPAARQAAAGVIRQVAPDLVHCNGSRAMLIAGIAARRFGLPAVWHVRVEGRDFLDRFLWSRCSALISPSRTVARRFPPQRIAVIPNPVSLPERRRDDPAVSALRRDMAQGRAHILLAVGELTPRKNVIRIVESLAGLHGHDVQLVIAGREDPSDPGYPDRVRAVAERIGAADRVTLLGFRTDVADLMLAADLLVHAPEAEGFGRVFIEAMAAGLPLVCTPVGGLSELHAETGFGWLTEDLSPAALTRTVAQALSDAGDRERFRAAGPQIAAEHFSVPAHARAVMEVYATLGQGL